MLRNETLWLEIESLDPFSDPKHYANALQHSAWERLATLQNGKHLTSIDLIALKGLLEVVYKLGEESAKQEIDDET